MYKNKDPLVSVIIVAFSIKRFDMTVDCIYSILNNTYKNFEIILTIDGNDQLKHKMEDRFKSIDKIRIIGDKKDEGPSIARNRCVEIANGDIVAFIDDDAFASTDWLTRIVQNFCDNKNVVIVGGKLLPIYSDDINNDCKSVYGKLPEELLWIIGCTYKGHAETKQHVRNVISANMAAKRYIFDDVSFESICNNKSRFFAPIKQLEDTLFCVNVYNNKSGTILYDPDTIVYHNVPAERLRLSYIIKRSFSEGILKAQLGYIGKNRNEDKVLSHEKNYLYMLLVSIVKNILIFKIKDSLLLSITIMSTMVGYISGVVLYSNRK